MLKILLSPQDFARYTAAEISNSQEAAQMTNAFLAKLLKNKNNLVLYVILIIGIVLMLFSGSKPAPDKKAAADTVSEQRSFRA